MRFVTAAILFTKVPDESLREVPRGALVFGSVSVVHLWGDRAVGHGISISRDGHPVPTIRPLLGAGVHRSLCR